MPAQELPFFESSVATPVPGLQPASARHPGSGSSAGVGKTLSARRHQRQHRTPYSRNSFPVGVSGHTSMEYMTSQACLTTVFPTSYVPDGPDGVWPPTGTDMHAMFGGVGCANNVCARVVDGHIVPPPPLPSVALRPPSMRPPRISLRRSAFHQPDARRSAWNVPTSWHCYRGEVRRHKLPQSRLSRSSMVTYSTTAHSVAYACRQLEVRRAPRQLVRGAPRKRLWLICEHPSGAVCEIAIALLRSSQSHVSRGGTYRTNYLR